MTERAENVRRIGCRPGAPRQWAIAALAMIAWTGFVGADPARDYQIGTRAYAQDDLITAMQHLERAADAGHVEAQVLLGYIYDKAEEHELAIRYYRQAVEGGSAEAAFVLGTLYASGDGVPRDLAVARDWYEQAAATGHGMALQTLGMAYAEGRLGLQKDVERGRGLLREAVRNGHEPAKTLLESLGDSPSGGDRK